MAQNSNRNPDITIAVFPFENLTLGDELRIFCEGFAFDLVTELSRFRQFQIVSFQSTKAVHLSQESAETDWLKELHADYIIRGSFHSFNETLRINAQLINTHTNVLTWAERFDGKLESIFAIQEDLLRKIVSSLQQQVDCDILSCIRKKPETNFSAYEYWLRGLDELQKGTLDTDVKAREYFQKAIEIDPRYNLAYTGMSLTYFNEWSCQLWDRWEVSRNGAFEWARKAIELNEWDYVSATILGRVYLYNGEYEKSEYFLRQALRLNPNDADNLILIAYGLVYLGYAAEARQYYEKALHLNPVGNNAYFACGAIIKFELGEFEEAIALGKKNQVGNNYVDFMAFMAAAYYATGDLSMMEECWQSYLREFSMKINKGKPADTQTGLQWMINVNPYKGATNLKPFWEYIGNHPLPAIPLDTPGRSGLPPGNCFVREGDFWQLSFAFKTVQMPDLRGLHDLEKLLSQPNTAVHCTALMGVPVVERGVPVFDEKAKKAYQRRILELQQDIEEASSFHDTSRMGNLQEEYDRLLEHLTRSVGMGQKVRKASAGVEKARTAVTWRIRNAIKRIASVHPPLGKHLEVSVKTGTFCTYAPENEVHWIW